MRTLASHAVVFCVDDDVSVRESLHSLLTQAGHRVEVFAAAEAFLARSRPQVPHCLVLDVSLPGLDGLEVQRRLSDRVESPVIFITAHGDIPMTVRAMKAGAVEFLTKPYEPHALLAAIESALALSGRAIADEGRTLLLRERYRTLTAREAQVMALVVRGRLNKRVGGELGISEITVKAHRGRVMRKMNAASLAELVGMAAHLGHSTAGAD